MSNHITHKDFKTYLNEVKENSKIENYNFSLSHCKTDIESLHLGGMIELNEYEYQINLLNKYFAKWFPLGK